MQRYRRSRRTWDERESLPAGPLDLVVREHPQPTGKREPSPSRLGAEVLSLLPGHAEVEPVLATFVVSSWFLGLSWFGQCRAPRYRSCTNAEPVPGRRHIGTTSAPNRHRNGTDQYFEHRSHTPKGATGGRPEVDREKGRTDMKTRKSNAKGITEITNRGRCWKTGRKVILDAGVVESLADYLATKLEADALFEAEDFLRAGLRGLRSAQAVRS